jgi:ferric-dicitrate binding protein FerR (iron transport regulator)
VALLKRIGIVFVSVPLLIIIGTANTRADDPTDALVVWTRGYAVVRLKTASSFVPLVKGTHLGIGDTIQTGDKAKVQLELPDGSTVVIGANSWVVINELGMLEVTKSSASTFYLLRGKIRAVVVRLLDRDSRFTIETNNATVGVRGTDFGVTYDPNGDTTYLLAFTGSVSLTLAHFPDLIPIVVTKGEEITVSGDEQPPKPSRAPEATLYEFLTEMRQNTGDHGDRGGGRGGGEGGGSR